MSGTTKQPLMAHRALQLAALAVPIIKHLAATDRTMTYKEFGQAIGLVRQAWQPWYYKEITSLLHILQTTFRHFEEAELDWHRIAYSPRQDGHRYQGRNITRSTH